MQGMHFRGTSSGPLHSTSNVPTQCLRVLAAKSDTLYLCVLIRLNLSSVVQQSRNIFSLPKTLCHNPCMPAFPGWAVPTVSDQSTVVDKRLSMIDSSTTTSEIMHTAFNLCGHSLTHNLAFKHQTLTLKTWNSTQVVEP